MTAVVGLDTRTRAFHWVSSIQLGGRRYGWVEEPDKMDVENARAALYHEARRFFQLIPRGAHVFCEEPLALHNGKTTRLLCLVAGAIWSAFIQANPDATWYWIDNSSWKREILGRGSPPNRGKHKPWIEQTLLTSEDFIAWLHVDLKSRGDFMTQTDLYDAWCLMRYGIGVVDSLHGRA